MRISDWSSDVCSSDLLQDCQGDYRALDRVYLPQDWLAVEGLDVRVLDAAASPAGFRRLLDRCLDGVDGLLEEAGQLPRQLRSARLAMESALVLRLACRLARRLRAGDPLARSEEHTSELQSIMRITSAVFCLTTKQIE